MTVPKIIGFVIGVLGLLVVLLDHFGIFLDKNKTNLAALIRNSQDEIPRGSPGFDEFLVAFPPPPDITVEDVTCIQLNTIQTHDGFPVARWFRYVAQGVPTEPVATFDDIRRWSEQTSGWWIGLIIASVGWLVALVVELRARQKGAT